MRVLEALGDRGVHVNDQLLLHGQFLVAGVGVESHEVTELASDKTVDAVDHPLAGQPVPVRAFGEHDQDLGIQLGLLEDLGQAKAFVLRDVALSNDVAVNADANYQFGRGTYKFLLPCTMSRMNQMLMQSTCGR